MKLALGRLDFRWGRKASKLPRKYLIFFAIAPLLLLLDQLTKHLLIRRFALGETLSVIEGLFNITYVRNKGAAFGMFANSTSPFRAPVFILVPILALGVIGYVFRKIHPRDLKLAAGLSLVIAGAAGNLIDRVTWGYVVDFLDFHWQYRYHFPAFNLADSAICVGVALLTWDMILEGTS